MSETDAAITNRLHEIFPNQQVASKMVDLLVHKRPLGWSKKSNSPYYKEVYAEQIKADIDSMITDGIQLVYRYDIWCNEKDPHAMSQQTLYTRINQSIRFLVEQMDTPDNKYRKWYDSVNIRRVRGLGLTIAFVTGLSSAQPFKAEAVQPKEHMPIWKRDMEEWLESDNQRPFIVERLALTPEEIAQLKSEFSQLSNVMASVTSSSIKIIRTGL